MTLRAITFAGFAVIFALGAAWGALNASRPNSLSLDRIIRALTRTRAARLILLLGWAWVGWHLFARGSGAFK